jgi:hypothetical protein
MSIQNLFYTKKIGVVSGLKIGAGQLGVLSTNNSLEATNLQIKNKFIKRIRKPISEFLPILSQIRR